MSDNLNLDSIKTQFQSNKKMRLGTYIAAGVVAFIIGFVLYQQFVSKPKALKAEDAYWAGLNLAVKDSTDAAISELQGVVKKYDGYKGGEVAEFVLGRQYMNKGDFKKAIEVLGAVKLKDTYVQADAIGLQGDCYSELKDYKKAAEMYKKAANVSKNEMTTPKYLFKAALCAEELNDFNSALKLYEEIRDDYTNFAAQKTIEKYIARVSSVAKK